MTGVLINLLIVAIIIAIIAGIGWAIWTLIAPKVPSPFNQIIVILFWGIIALVLVLYILVPLIRLLPAAAGA